MGRSSSQHPLWLAACLLLALLLLNSFRIDWGHVTSGGSIDLRNRITGARIMAAGIDPFRYKWKPGEPAEYCDPYNNSAVAISKTTITPTFLLVKLPLAQFSFSISPQIWLICQWLCLLGTGALWLRACGSDRERWMWACLIVGFTYTVGWRLHADRGQGYVLPLLLFAAWFALMRKPSPRSHLAAGVLAGLIISLRPHYLLILAPFMLLRRRDQILPAAISLAILVAVPMLWDVSCWSDFHAGMSEWSNLYRNNINPRPPPLAFPAVVEGMPIDQLGRFAIIPFADSSIYALFRSFGWTGVPDLPVTLFFAILIAAWYFFSRKQTDAALLIGIAGWTFIGDFFLPALRNCYNDVLILNVMAIAWISGKALRPALILALLSIPLGWWVLAEMPRARWMINLPTLAMLAASVLCLWVPRSAKPQEN